MGGDVHPSRSFLVLLLSECAAGILDVQLQ